MVVAKGTIHFFQKGLPASEMLGAVDYNEVHDVVSGHPGFTNVGTNVSQTLSKKWFFKTNRPKMVEGRCCRLSRRWWPC